ncbi:MAG: hypothetical protein BWY04_00036 [candidate division CPR1 bacterium ADurb.Bin160]|uniref:Uncharacterized protein n=1 Tax=candidate division CPR1 bacterium ADurb.Bin160 TaxID=1852826 RepID=A0A1V5ZQJ3_9BACT|nr:MAG: hypothetical protein BWY04_00036 [candidate division CPR1 bacterium ADurb.Bin160]
MSEESVCFAYILRLIEQNLNRDISINPDCSILPDRINYTLINNHKVFSKIYKYKKFNAQKELKNWNKDFTFREYANIH